jgi:acyl-CoA thioesterase-1
MIVVAAACRGSAKSSADTAIETHTDRRESTAANERSVDESAARGRRGLLFVGTSLTAGLGLEPDSAYPMLIQAKIDSAGLPYEVTNAGVSGETSAGLLDRLDWLLRGRFDVLVLETGANDGLRGIPTATLKRNLETAIDRIRAARPEAQLVLVQMEALPNLGPEYASAFHALYGDVAREKRVPLLPFLLANVAGHRELNQSDGMHPNHVGEHIVAENVWRGLEPFRAPRARSGGPVDGRPVDR